MLKLLDFYAEWCPPCQQMKPVIAEVEEELKNQVEFEVVNVDENREKAQEYEVMSIPTYVLVKDGEEVDRKMGAIEKAQFKSWIESFVG